MDSKTLVSSLFAATVVVGATVTTVVDPDLRGLFVRMVSPRVPPPVVREDRPRPNEWPSSLELVVDPSLVAPMHAWGTGESYCTDEMPLSGEVELVELAATARSDSDLFVRFRIGDWSCYQYFDIELVKATTGAVTIAVDARWWIDIGRPIMVDTQGHPIAGYHEEVDEPEHLSGVVGHVTIDSLDWTPGHAIAVRLALGCEFGEPENWCWIEGGGTTTIQSSQ